MIERSATREKKKKMRSIKVLLKTCFAQKERKTSLHKETTIRFRLNALIAVRLDADVLVLYIDTFSLSLFSPLALSIDTHMRTWLNRSRHFTRRSYFSSVSDVHKILLSPCSCRLSRSNSSMILRLFSSLVLVILLAHGVQSTSSKFDVQCSRAAHFPALVLSVAQRGGEVLKLLKENRERLKHGSRTSTRLL